jgi:hypothetical protein
MAPAIISVIIALVISTAAAAQGVQGGIEAGLASTSLSNITSAINFGGPVDVERRTGLAIGAFVRVVVKPAVAVQIEALYATKGASPTDGTNKLEIKLSYLDVPVLIQIAPSPTGPFYLMFGPSVNFNLGAKTIDPIPDNVEDDVADEIANVEFSVVAGAGIRVKRGIVEVRYVAGLTDIGDSVRLAAPVKNRGLLLIAGVRF